MMSRRTAYVGAARQRPLHWLVWNGTEPERAEVATIVEAIVARARAGELPKGSTLERIDGALKKIAAVGIGTTVRRSEVIAYRKALEDRERAITDVKAGAARLRSLAQTAGGRDALVQLPAIIEKLDDALRLIEADPYRPFDPTDRSLFERRGHPPEEWTRHAPSTLVRLGVRKREARVLVAFIRSRAKRRARAT